MHNFRTSFGAFILILSAVVLAGNFGCGEASKGGGGTTLVNVDADEVNQKAPQNADALMTFSGDLLDFLNDFQVAFENPPEEVDSVNNPPDVERPSQDEQREVVSTLEQKIFHSNNLVSETDTQLEYLISGDVACADESPANEADCVADVDAVEARIIITSPAAETFDARLAIGPDRSEPLTLSLAPDQLEVSLNLVELERAVSHVNNVLDGEELDLPETLTGTITASITKESADRGELNIALPTGLLVEEGDFRLELQPSPNAISVKADRAAGTLRAALGLEGFDLAFEDVREEYDGTDFVTTREEVHLAAPSVRGSVTATSGEAAIALSEISFGDGPATLDIDGNREASVQLNREDGRQFSASISEDADGVEVKVQPTLDLELDMKFQALKKRIDDVGDWATDETFRARLFGAAEPTIRFASERLHVIDGELLLSSEASGITHEASAMQCLISNDVANASHPLEEIEVAACQL